jgi:CO/xanthine dehydrogenase FAD-binding subunit
MERFTYVRAVNTAEAVSLLNDPAFMSRPLAGSTDLILMMRKQPGLINRVVDISLIPVLHRIEQVNNRVVIGAAATFTEVLSHPLIKQTGSILAEACKTVGAVQIRNMGTVGGNVANAAACADSLPALVCLDADARVITPSEVFSWTVSELVLSPNKTRIPAGGLLESLSYQIPPDGTRGVFLKLGRRNAMAISRLTVAALGRVDENGLISEARFVTGSAAPQITRFQDVESSLVGNHPTPALLLEAGKLATDEMIKLSGNRWSSEYKVPALAAMTSRALAKVFQVSLEKMEAV